MPKQPAQPQRQTPFTDSHKSETITFRLDPHNYSLIREKAVAKKQRTNFWARTALLDLLAREAIEQERNQRLEAIETEIASLRHGLADATEAILLTILTKKPMTVEQVRQWVATNLRTRKD